MQKLTSLIAAVLLFSACANRPLTPQEEGALTGAALGAMAGSIIGSATGGSSVTAAAAGMGLGALTGAMVGGAIENQRAERDNPPSSTAPTPTEPTAPQTPTESTEGTFNSPKAATIDPTVGKLVNSTRWRLEIFLDADPQDLEGAAGIELGPQESQSQNLDFGPHRIIARAYVDTQFGTRMVGRYDRTIQVDPRGSGWTLHFTEDDFR